MKKQPEVYCCVSGVKIPALRVKALSDMGVHPSQMTCIEVASKSVKKVKGIYPGLPGVTSMILCDSVRNDSVRRVFHKADAIDATVDIEDVPEKVVIDDDVDDIIEKDID